MKKILITGVSGFIGSHCYDYFSKNGYAVFGIDRNLCNKPDCIKGTVSFENLCSFNTSFDYIIHLAGSGTVGESSRNPDEEFKKTVESTKELLKFIDDTSPKTKIIYSSSAAVYGDGYKIPIKESFPINPFSAYGEHKVLVEKLLQQDNVKNNRQHVIIRFFSVYGEGLKKQVLWDTCNRIKDNMCLSAINCFGTGNELRDFIHIEDALQMINLSMKEEVRGVYNCGTGISTSISCIINKLGSLLEYSGDFYFENERQKGNPGSLIADISSAKSLGFVPSVSLEDGLKRYTEWVMKQI